MTNNFIQVMLQKFEPNTIQNISVNGENKYRVLVVGMDDKVTVNGKVVIKDCGSLAEPLPQDIKKQRI